MIFMKKLTTRLLSLVLLGAFIPSFVLADSWYLENGDITIKATSDTSQTVTQGENSKEDSNPTISNWDPNGKNAGNTGSTSKAIIIEAAPGAEANVTLENVNIDTSATGKAAITTSGQGNVNIELDGTNTVQSGTNYAGVEKTNGGTLTITDTNQDNGSLTATGGFNGAGIGGGYAGSGSSSNITIEGGKVEATGGFNGAGIGGGAGGSGSNITIFDGEVTATGGGGGAGIGGGQGGGGSNIAIKGGKVEATGGYSGAGIGGGEGGSGSNITISDGKVTATGTGAGAGIGGGYAGSGEGITIEGGEVTAQGDTGGAGIGCGGSGSGTGTADVTISGDAQVKVQGGRANESWHKGAAIGNGGYYTTDGNEVSPNTSDLTVEGFIQIYEPGKNINTDTPDKTIEGQKGDHSWNAGEVTTPATCTAPGVRTYTCTENPAHTRTEPIPALNHLFGAYIYDNNATCTQDGTETAKCERCNETDTRTAKGSKLTGNTAETAAEARQDAYWVCGADGQALPYQSQVKDGVLTVTVQADTASLRGTTGSLRQLEAQGITGIRFVTNRAQSDFTLSDLLTSGTGSFTLTHDGETVTFTLAEKDISGILK